MNRVSRLAFAFAPALACAVYSAEFNVMSFGAVGDGKTLDTAALQKTIDAAAAKGGGEIYFPTGRFLSGTLTLKSNITLHLSPGAMLLGSAQMADYPVKHLLFAESAENIAIEGGGAIDGQGTAFFDANWKPASVRPSPLLEFEHVQRLRIENVTVRNAPAWTIRPKDCEDVKIHGITLLNDRRAVNTDGIDVDSSRNVIISDCHIEAGDDCIVLKTTLRGNEIVGSTENVVVTNCVLKSAATALKLGTESHGDFRHILFSNCVVRDSRTGVALYAKDGGTMEDVHCAQIVMTTIPKWESGLEWPIVIDVEKRTEQSRLSHISDIGFNDITIYSKGRIMVSGTPESRIQNLTFNGVTYHSIGYETIKSAKKPRGGSSTVAAGMPDYSATPAAMIFDYVDGLTLDHVTITWPTVKDVPARQAIFGDQLEDVIITNFRGTASKADLPATRLENSTKVHS